MAMNDRDRQRLMRKAKEKKESSREELEAFFFDKFEKRFMVAIPNTRAKITAEYPGFMADITSNLQKISALAADEVLDQGKTLEGLEEQETMLLLNMFYRDINEFAQRVESEFSNLSSEKAAKLTALYAGQ